MNCGGEGYGDNDPSVLALADVKACLRWQLVLVCVWSQMYVLSVFVETRRNQLLILSTWILAALALSSGRWLTKSGNVKMVARVISPAYALFSTLLCCAVLAVANIPRVQDVDRHSLYGTLLSGALACVSVKATASIQQYCDSLSFTINGSRAAKTVDRRDDEDVENRARHGHHRHHHLPSSKKAARRAKRQLKAAKETVSHNNT